MRQPTPEEWASICGEFDALADLPQETQERRLADAAIDPFVAAQVRSLLQAARSDGVLDGSPLSSAESGEHAYASLDPGARIGAFKIERLIGRGGMGEVYLAERVEGGFAQDVALKMLRPEAAGRGALFDVERAMLATLEHPGIARLIDGGVAADGRAYMALEYVEGEEIDAWCAARDASLAERLRLFLEICDAVTYAHGRLIVHRDIKPSNILIDADGRARLLDFGVAKILDDVAADRTTTQAMLTPDYAAPEQFENSRATVATDVYALGATLFQLLTGAGPWRTDEAPLPSVIRRLLHEDPPVPSRFAATRDPAPVPPARIAGDLDAIILKAMRRNPADRYVSVAALAEDVRRHREFMPVRARAGSTRYQVGRFVRRHRWGVAAAAAVLLALLVGAGGIAWQARQTAIERDLARAEARRSAAVNRTVTLMFRNASDSGRAGNATARELLDRAARDFVATLDRSSPDAADTVVALVDLYILIEDVAGADALATRALAAGVGRGDPAATARLQLRLAQARNATSRTDQAAVLLDAAERVWRTDPARFRVERMETISARAYMMRMSGNREEGIRLLAESMPEAEIAYADDPRELLIRYANLALHYVEANRLEEGGRVLDRGEQIIAETHSESTPPAFALAQTRGAWLARSGDLAGAQAVFRRTAALRRELNGPSAGLALDLLQLGRTTVGLGQAAEGLRILREAEGMIGTFLGSDSVPGMMISLSQAEALGLLERTAEAEAILVRVEPSMRRIGPRSLEYGAYLRSRAQVRLSERRFDESQADLDAADAIFAPLGTTGAYYRQGTARIRARLEQARRGS